MKINKYTKTKSNKYIVEFDKDKIELYDDVIVKYELLRKKEISKNDLKKILDYNNKLEAYYKSLKYLNTKLRTELEIRKYLKDYSSRIVDETIKKLKEEKYLNDELYIKTYLNDRISLSLNGPNKIKSNLINLGLNEELIEQYISSVSNDIWNEKIEKYINKKVNSNHHYGLQKLKEKITYELLQEGYYKFQISSYINSIKINDNNSILEKEFNKIYLNLQRKNKVDKYQIINKLLLKGFSYDEINDLLAEKKIT